MEVMERPVEDLDRMDYAASSFAARWALPLLRTALGITYVWFGLLKLMGVSPVADLVGKMSFGLPKGFFVRVMGVWETALGIALLFRWALRLTLPLYFAQLAGTFLVFLAHPQETFQRGNPLLLTKTGEFIAKNLVLLTAGLAVGATVRPGREEIRPVPQGGTTSDRTDQR
jgi:hypothetical protein